MNLIQSIRLYLSFQSTGLWHYCKEQLFFVAFGWIPTVLGIVVRAVAYRCILSVRGTVAIENGVRLRFARNIFLDSGVFLDFGVYLHACPHGIRIGKNSKVLHGAVLHVYNFRNLSHSGISIGKDCLIGEYTVIRGQGGVNIGDRVYTSPFTQIIAVNHVFDDPHRPFIEQGITAQGINVEDDVWLGAGAIITDGVRIGKGAVVAAGAVVTKDVAPGTVVAGVPARVIRTVGDGKGKTARGSVYAKSPRI